MSEIDHTSHTPISPQADSSLKIALIALLILIAATVTRIGLLSAPPEFDELYHLLAARGWLNTGQFTILDGEYTRAAPYTHLVVKIFQLTGQDNLGVARLVSVIPGVMLPVILFVWLRGIAGWTAACIAAVFAIAWPQGIIEAQLLRFYSVHVLLFFLGAMCAYEAVTRATSNRWVFAICAFGFFAAAGFFQITTAIGVGGIALWLVVRGILGVWGRPALRLPVLSGLAAMLVAIIGVLILSGVLEKAWSIYRFSPGNATATRDYVAFYHNGLRQAYETFWPLFPIAVLMAYRVNPELTGFCTAIFTTVFLAQSFGALKANRYMSGAMMFFFVIAGLAGTFIVSYLRDFAQTSQVSVRLIAITVAVCLVFSLLSNGFVITSAKLAAGSGISQQYRPNLSQVGAALGADHPIPFLATSHELHMAAYLGNYDVDLRGEGGWAAEFDPESPFGLDPRTGRYAVRAGDGFKAMLACKRVGVLVTVPTWWRGPTGGIPFQQSLADAGLDLETTRQHDLLIVRWTDPLMKEPVCAGLPL